MVVILVLAVAARAEQKNVKLLTGLTDLELQRTMNLMRASIGTHCDYCHVIKEEWDFASDEKPQKVRAREMMRMVMEINRSTFGGQSVVSCYTCHRGSPHPVTLVALPQAPPPFPTPLPEKPQLLDAKDVIAKYAAALGDASRLKLPRVLKGERINSRGSVPIEVIEKDGKVRMTVDGKRIPPADVSTAYAIVMPSEIAEGAKTIAKENDQWVVARGNQRFYFDAASGLLVRTVLLTPRPVGTIPQQTDYEDYRDVGGTKFPFRVRVSMVDPWSSAARQYTSVELGAAVEDAVFEP